MPALLTRMSIRPPSTEVASWASAREASGLPSRSACTNSARPPRDRIPSTPSLPRCPLRPEMTTCAPSAANSSAIARPMLLVAPVTSAVLPSSRPVIRVLLAPLLPVPRGTDRGAARGSRFGPDPLPGCENESGLASPETPHGAPGSERDRRRSAAALSGQRVDLTVHFSGPTVAGIHSEQELNPRLRPDRVFLARITSRCLLAAPGHGPR